MAIQRSGPTPQFFEYIIGNALIPKSNPPPEEIISLTTYNLQWVDVPNYQRGIAWEIENIEDLFTSDSVLLGNVILGQFPVDNNFNFLPETVTNYSVLVDGLQRFSVGTLILTILHPLVFSSHPSRAADSAYFNALGARCIPLAPVYLYNDFELSNHPRQAISGSYKNLRASFRRNIERRFANGEGASVAEEILNLFLHKQIAVDIYFNFNNPLQLMNTFIGINTVRVDLGPVDLLRSYIVEKAVSSGWNMAEIEDMENKFTELFSQNDKPRVELLPFVSIILLKISGSGQEPTTVFPSWESNLLTSEVFEFLEFIEEFLGCENNGYVIEIRNCGATPFASILSYYYNNYRHVSGNKPSFLSGGTNENDELHKFLCATYRVFLDGRIRLTRIYGERLFEGTILSLSDVADDMSMAFLALDTSQTVDVNWLKTVLKRVDRKRAQRVFNALRLGEKTLGWGSEFLPDNYGTRAIDYHVDHLIPTSVIDIHGDGANEAQKIMNLAPLPSNQNRVARATSCSSKLANGGIYDNYISTSDSPHEYCQWLVQSQGSYGSDLDRQELLEPNMNPDIGIERLGWIAANLLQRL
jgi:hypothetical protein